MQKARSGVSSIVTWSDNTRRKQRPSRDATRSKVSVRVQLIVRGLECKRCGQVSRQRCRRDWQSAAVRRCGFLGHLTSLRLTHSLSLCVKAYMAVETVTSYHTPLIRLRETQLFLDLTFRMGTNMNHYGQSQNCRLVQWFSRNLKKQRPLYKRSPRGWDASVVDEVCIYYLNWCLYLSGVFVWV